MKRSSTSSGDKPKSSKKARVFGTGGTGSSLGPPNRGNAAFLVTCPRGRERDARREVIDLARFYLGEDEREDEKGGEVGGTPDDLEDELKKLREDSNNGGKATTSGISLRRDEHFVPLKGGGGITFKVSDGECSGIVIFFLKNSKDCYGGHLSEDDFTALVGGDKNGCSGDNGDDGNGSSSKKDDSNKNDDDVINCKSSTVDGNIVNKLTVAIFSAISTNDKILSSPFHPKTTHLARFLPLLTTFYPSLPMLLRQFEKVVKEEMVRKEELRTREGEDSGDRVKTFQILYKSRFCTLLPERNVLIRKLAELVPQEGKGVKFKVDLSGGADYSILVECVKCLGGVGVVEGGGYGKWKKMNYGEFVGERGFTGSDVRG